MQIFNKPRQNIDENNEPFQSVIVFCFFSLTFENIFEWAISVSINFTFCLSPALIFRYRFA